MSAQRFAVVIALWAALIVPALAQQKYADASGKVRVALAKQPLGPNGPSKGPTTMAEGGIQKILQDLGAVVRVDEARLTAEEDTEYGGWKRLGMSLGHFADIVSKNERDGYFTVGLLATCPSMPGLVAGLQRSGPTREPIKQLAALFESIFARYPKASAIGFATIPPTDKGGLSIAALNRMIAAAVRGVKARKP